MNEYNQELCDRVQKDINSKINVLFDIKAQHEDRLQKLEITFTRFESVPGTLKDIHSDLKSLTDLGSAVKDNAYWVGKVKWGVSAIAIISIGGGLAALAFSGVCRLLGMNV